MFEDVGCIRAYAPPEYETSVAQFVQRIAEFRRLDPTNEFKQLPGELAPDDRTCLGHLLTFRQPIEPRGKRIVQGRRYYRFGAPSRQRMSTGILAAQVRLQNGFGEFLDKQRNAVSPSRLSVGALLRGAGFPSVTLATIAIARLRVNRFNVSAVTWVCPLQGGENSGR